MILSTISDLEKTLDDTKEMQKRYNSAIKNYPIADDEFRENRKEHLFMELQNGKKKSKFQDSEEEREFSAFSEDLKAKEREIRAKDEIRDLELKSINITDDDKNGNSVFDNKKKSVSIKVEEKDFSSANPSKNLDEKKFLEILRDSNLVLFEGLQSPSNQQLEKKVDLILNYLEFQLSHIEDRLEKIE